MHSIITLVPVLLIGMIVGMVNGVVGGGSVISYPVMLATGLNPIAATITNSVGVSSANLFALIACLRRSYVDLRAWIGTALASAGGAAFGIFLLLKMPARVFDYAVPFLVLFAALSVLIRVPAPKPSDSPRPRHVIPSIVGSGIYCGYFGPGQGVMVLSTLTHDGRLTTHEINVIKNFIIGLTGIVTAAIFIASGRVAWPQASMLFIGSGIGGFIGGHFASKFPASIFRLVIFVIGLGSSIYLGLRLI
ncbi:MAG TPA: sulfite exporter TauE/SafE family protein [Candidatus Nanopelagicaceae bacterium]|nr:sulfite exporter TauE/SafE family protein [Candidatus Nanopelagicaceae bacterium]